MRCVGSFRSAGTADPVRSMAIYSRRRRRTVAVLLLTSTILITLDLRGNAVFDATRTAFGYALRPFEIAGDVVTRPIVRAWQGISDVDDLRRENERLQAEVDAQRSAEIAAQNALIENRELRDQVGLESLAAFDKVSAGIIGSSPSNFDQQVEIDRGSLDGIRVGMPVVNAAGLVGKITRVSLETSIVMLITDPSYTVPVKVVAGLGFDAIGNPSDTVPSGLDIANVTTPASTTTTTPLMGRLPTSSTISTTTTTTTTTTMLTVVVNEITRETGALMGFGATRLPRVSFIADSPQFGRIRAGDAVLTSGGSESLSPPNIPIGRVANVIQRIGVAGLELEVELNADLEHLGFLTVILYQPPTELVLG